MAKNNKTRFFYVLYSDKTRVFDQSKRAYYPIYIIIKTITACYLLENQISKTFTNHSRFFPLVLFLFVFLICIQFHISL